MAFRSTETVMTVADRTPGTIRHIPVWQGRSGNTYIASVAIPSEADLYCHRADLDDAVLIAVSRDPDGRAELIDACADYAPADRDHWIRAMFRRDATEIQAHRHTAKADARRAVVADLIPDTIAHFVRSAA